MIKKLLLKIFFLVSVLICSFSIRAEEDTTNVWEMPSSPAPLQIKLPINLNQQLSKTYPGFRIAEKKDYCPNYLAQHLQLAGVKEGGSWAYGVLSEDFNGDLLKDYALIIQHQGKWIIVSALKNKDQAYTLKTLAPAMVSGGERSPKHDVTGRICDGLFNIQPSKTLMSDFEPNHQGINPYPAIGLDNAGAGMYFYYKGGWQETGYEP